MRSPPLISALFLALKYHISDRSKKCGRHTPSASKRAYNGHMNPSREENLAALTSYYAQKMEQGPVWMVPRGSSNLKERGRLSVGTFRRCLPRLRISGGSRLVHRVACRTGISRRTSGFNCSSCGSSSDNLARSSRVVGSHGRGGCAVVFGGEPLVDSVDEGDNRCEDAERPGTPPWWALGTGSVNGRALPKHGDPRCSRISTQTPESAPLAVLPDSVDGVWQGRPVQVTGMMVTAHAVIIELSGSEPRTATQVHLRTTTGRMIALSVGSAVGHGNARWTGNYQARGHFGSLLHALAGTVIIGPGSRTRIPVRLRLATGVRALSALGPTQTHHGVSLTAITAQRRP